MAGPVKARRITPRKIRQRKLVIERDGLRVHFIVECEDIYAAMQFYDRAIADAKAGVLDLTIVLRCASDGGERSGA